MKAFIYYVHDYMDMKPDTYYILEETIEEAREKVAAFRDRWNSGTISDVHEVTAADLKKILVSNGWTEEDMEEVLSKIDKPSNYYNIAALSAIDPGFFYYLRERNCNISYMQNSREYIDWIAEEYIKYTNKYPKGLTY